MMKTQKSKNGWSSLGFLVGALWWGSLTTIGFVVVPLLFVWVSPKALAGLVAGRVFEGVSWLSLLAPVLLGLASQALNPLSPGGPEVRDWAHRGTDKGAEDEDDERENEGYVSRQWHQTLWGLFLSEVLAAWMLAVVIPHITSGAERAIWHSVGSATYALMWVLATAVMLKSRRFWS